MPKGVPNRPGEVVPAPNNECARRVKRNGRIVILPPAGHGSLWAGGTRRTGTEITKKG